MLINKFCKALRLTACLAVVAGACQAGASPLYQGWTSVRALGMGNAYTAVASGSDAIFYNPAALSHATGLNWTIADPMLGADGTAGYQAYQKYQQGGNAATLFESLYGQNFWFGGGAQTALALPGFGFAAFTDGDANLRLSNPAYPALDGNFYADYGLALSLAFDPVPEFVSFGATLKKINRTGATLNSGAGDIAQLNTTFLQNEIKNRGSGYGLDLGLLLSAPLPFVKPSLSVTWRDVGSTAFSHDEGLAAPDPIASTLSVGGALQISGPGVRITPAFDYRYLDRGDIQTGEKISLGVEVELLMLTLRGGVNQGYFTAGVGLDFGLGRLDVATYAVELGQYAGQAEDRRYVAQLTLELDFDPGGYFSSKKSSSSASGGPSQYHLFQRR